MIYVTKFLTKQHSPMHPPQPTSHTHLYAFPIFLLLFSLFYFLSVPFHASAAMHPGFKTESLWLPNENVKLDIAIFYPTLKVPTEITYGDWTLTVSTNAKPIFKKHPTIIFSHDTGCSRLSLHHLATALAQKGFVVLAPNHQGDNTNDMSLIFSLQQIKKRICELNSTINFVLQEKDLIDIVDPKQIIILGVGTGGTAALLLAGATLDPAPWDTYCDSNSNALYCSPWIKKKMDSFVKSINPCTKYLNPKISAIIPIAPNYEMFFTKNSLTSIKIPILLIEVQNNCFNEPKNNPLYISQQLSIPHEFLIINDVSSLAFIAPCSNTLEHSLPEMCTKKLDPIKNRVKTQLIEIIEKFSLNTFTK